MFRLLGLPRGTTLENLTFNDLLSVANTIVEKALELKVSTQTNVNTCLYLIKCYSGQHGGAVINTVTSRPEGPRCVYGCFPSVSALW